jgi:hypothetical protein
VAIFYQPPPPPFIGGAQPDAPRTVPPQTTAPRSVTGAAVSTSAGTISISGGTVSTTVTGAAGTTQAGSVTTSGGVLAAIVNIHPNLTAWASGTYSVGNRVSSSGNAYQCTIAGTSTAAPTGTGADIAPGGVAHWKWLSAIDYTSMQAWWNATPTSPSAWTTSYIVQNWNNGEVTATGAGQFFNTDVGGTKIPGSFTALITCAPGESIRDKPGSALTYNASSGVAFSADATITNHPFRISYDGITFDGLQARGLGSATGKQLFNCANGVSIQRCLLDYIPTDLDGQQHVYFITANSNVTDSVIIDRRAANAGGECVKWDLLASGEMIGCTVISVNGVSTLNRGTGIKAIGVTNSVTVRNSSFWNYTSPMIDDNSVAFIVDHCVTSAASWDNISLGINDAGNNLVSKTTANQFVTATSAADLRPKLGADTIGAGVVDLTDIPDGLDFYRNLRGAVWDVGPAEYSVSVSAAVTGASVTTHGGLINVSGAVRTVTVTGAAATTSPGVISISGAVRTATVTGAAATTTAGTVTAVIGGTSASVSITGSAVTTRAGIDTPLVQGPFSIDWTVEYPGGSPPTVLRSIIGAVATTSGGAVQVSVVGAGPFSVDWTTDYPGGGVTVSVGPFSTDFSADFSGGGSPAIIASVTGAGALATGHAGTLVGVITLSGVSATTTAGTVIGSVPGSATVTGARVTTAATTIAPSLQSIGAGARATTAAGSVTTASSGVRTAIGAGVTTSAGSTALTLTTAQTGTGVTAAAGTVVPSVAPATAIGAVATTHAGAVAGVPTAIGTGVTASAGTVVPLVAKALTGATLTATAGAVSFTALSQIPVVGASAVTAAGAVGITLSLVTQLTGAAVTAMAGTVVPLPAQSPTVTGVTATTTAGTVTSTLANTALVVEASVTTAAGAVAAPITPAVAGAGVTTGTGTASSLTQLLALIGASAITTAGSTGITGTAAPQLIGAGVVTQGGVTALESSAPGAVGITTAGDISGEIDIDAPALTVTAIAGVVAIPGTVVVFPATAFTAAGDVMTAIYLLPPPPPPGALDVYVSFTSGATISQPISTQNSGTNMPKNQFLRLPLNV